MIRESGKSTLLRALARLHDPTSGEVRFGDGSSASALSAKAFARRVTLLSQSRPTPTGICVRDVVEYGRHPYRGRFRADDADAAPAISGVTVQAVCRNPLAEPGLLGITAGAGVGAVTLLTFVPAAGVVLMTTVAGAGGLLVFALVYALSWRGGLSSDRLVLIGIAVWSGCLALITFIVVTTDPWNVTSGPAWRP